MTIACVSRGGCVSDYIAIGITCFVVVLVLIGICFMLFKKRDLELTNKKVSVLLVQACASLLYLSGVVLLTDYLRLSRKHFWDSCYLGTWLEGPFGFGLLLSCYIFRTYRLYYIFIARRLPRLKSYQLMAMLLVPWLVFSAVMQALKARDQHCSTSIAWWIGLTLLHVVYPLILVSGAWKVRHVRFKFNEFKELMNVALICGILLVIWGTATVVERVQHQHDRLQLTSRFILLLIAIVFVSLLFWAPLAKPVSELCKYSRKKRDKYSTMGQALGVPHSGLVIQHPAGFDFSRPLEFLLEDRKFRESFLKFAERRLAAEVVHFYNEVRELSKIHANEVVQRVYLAEHIIDKYIKSGSPMEINLSCQMRMEILNTRDLADPNLFGRVVNEALRMMQMNLLSDYWQSDCFQELKADREADIEAQYTDGLDQPEDGVVKKVQHDARDNPFERNGQSV